MSEKTREQFKQWARIRDESHAGKIVTNHGLDYPLGSLLWEAWQAARSIALEEAAKACESRVMGDNSREDGEAKRCASAIRGLAAGLGEGGQG